MSRVTDRENCTECEALVVLAAVAAVRISHFPRRKLAGSHVDLFSFYLAVCEVLWVTGAAIWPQ
jgi:hypothetical protein